MRRKYFIRGMGIGILITTLVFVLVMFFRGNNDRMSDAAVIERARELGYVLPENNTMSDNQNNTESDDTDNTEDTENTQDADALDSTEGTTEPEVEAENTETNGAEVTVETFEGEDVTPPPNETTDPITEAHRNEANNQTNSDTQAGTTQSSANIKKFTIRGGEDSATVGARLHIAGLVDSPGGFNTFLEQNGYDTRIQVGTYSIREGSSYETIAKIITGQ